MVRFASDDVYFKNNERLYYNDIIIKIQQIGSGDWHIINTANNKIQHLVTSDRNEIFLELIEHFINDIGIYLKDGEHLQFVDDTNESVR